MRWLSVVVALVAAGCTDPLPSAGDAGSALLDATPAPSDAQADAGPPCPACAIGSHCDDGACVPGECGAVAACPGAADCVEGVCALRHHCTSAADCPAGQCMASGWCAVGACAAHGDCPGPQRCARGRCVDRPGPEFPVLFEAYSEPALSAHEVLPEVIDEDGFGFALLDIDGDLDLDLFVGSLPGAASAKACLYRNDSVPAAPRFTPIATLCGDAMGFYHGALAVDLDGDGYHELVAMGFERLDLLRFHPTPSRVDLFAALPERRRGCVPGAGVALDYDFDGRIDIAIGCQLLMAGGTGGPPPGLPGNLIFVQRGDRLELLPPHDRFSGATGSTLAIAALDIDEDGIVDLLVAEDEGQTGRPEFRPHPGGVFRRCAPGDGCSYEHTQFVSGEAGWGCFTGIAAIAIGTERYAYITDVGANRLVPLPPSGEDHAAAFGIHHGIVGGTDLVGWGVAAQDLDRDGRDDLWVAQGDVRGFRRIPNPAHQDVVFLQRGAAEFTAYSEDIGILPLRAEEGGGEVYSARAVAFVDLDRDGYLDVVEAGMMGRLRLHREVPLGGAQSRCTLIPKPAVAAGFASGFAVDEGDGRWRIYNVQGQVRSSISPWPISGVRSGTLRFPSGAEVPFECAAGEDSVVVIEPEWLRVGGSEGKLRVALVAPWAAGAAVEAVFVSADDEVERVALGPVGSALESVSIPAAAQAVMLRIAGRFVGRLWPLR